jgi:hypothetical protein
MKNLLNGVVVSLRAFCSKVISLKENAPNGNWIDLKKLNEDPVFCAGLKKLLIEHINRLALDTSVEQGNDKSVIETTYVWEECFKVHRSFPIYSEGYELKNKGYVVSTKEGPKFALPGHLNCSFAKIEQVEALILKGDKDNEEMKAALAWVKSR